MQVVQLVPPSTRLEINDKGEIVTSTSSPLFFAMPEPQEVAEYIAYKRLKQQRVPERYQEGTFKFPESLYVLIHKPVVEKPKEKPAETPAYVAPKRTNRNIYVTTDFYILNTNYRSLKVYVEYQDGSGEWQKGSVTVGAGENLYIGRIAEGSRYYTDATGYTASWDDVGHNKAWVRMKF